jgi:cytochrome c-type biogenesis protein CcmF
MALASLASGALLALLGSRRQLPARFAHAGLALVLVGAGASATGTEFEGAMSPSDRVVVGPTTVELVSVGTGESDRYIYAEGVFEVEGGPVLRPQIRAYEDQSRPVSEPALWSTPARDLIIAISVLTPDAEAVEVTVLLRPMVWLVWLGALVAALGGALSLRALFGADARRRRSATTEQPSTGTTIGTIDH